MSDSDNNRKKKHTYLVTSEASDLLRVKPRTMDNWRSKGTGPSWRKHGGRVVYHIDEQERYSGDDRKPHAG